MKTSLRLTIAAIVLASFSLSTAVVQAQFTYTVTNATITITGYTGSGGDVTIPDTINGLPVTSIGFGAFQGTSLTSISIPNSVTTIGDAAFNSCFSLTSIAIRNTITSIATWVFHGCSSLTSVTIPNSVTNIGDWAFGFSGLTSVTIPNSVTSIGDWAFGFCVLTNVTIGNSVADIGAYAFGNCYSLTAITVAALNPVYSSEDGVLFDKSQTTLIEYPLGKPGTSYTIPSRVTGIETNAFDGCSSLTNVALPDKVTNIGDWAFDGCTGLSSVTIPSSVTNIGSYAFFRCTSLTSVTIPNSVASIGYEAFSDCTSLTGITVEALNLAYISVDGVLFDKSQMTLIQYPLGEPGTSYTIPSSVTHIEDLAFDFCTRLTSVTIPNSVTSIGVWALSNCTNLTSLYFQGNAPSADSSVFRNDNNATIYYLPRTTGWGTTFADLQAFLWDPLSKVACTTTNGVIIITGYTGPGGAVKGPVFHHSNSHFGAEDGSNGLALN